MLTIAFGTRVNSVVCVVWVPHLLACVSYEGHVQEVMWGHWGPPKSFMALELTLVVVTTPFNSAGHFTNEHHQQSHASHHRHIKVMLLYLSIILILHYGLCICFTLFILWSSCSF